MRTIFTFPFSLFLSGSFKAFRMEWVSAVANGSTSESNSVDFAYEWDDDEEETTLEYSVKQERRRWNEFLEHAVGVQSEVMEPASLDPNFEGRLKGPNLRVGLVPIVAASLALILLLGQGSSKSRDMHDGMHTKVNRIHPTVDPRSVGRSERLNRHDGPLEGADLSTLIGDGNWNEIFEMLKGGEGVPDLTKSPPSWSDGQGSDALSGADDGSFDVILDSDVPPKSYTQQLSRPASRHSQQRLTAWQAPMADVASALEEMADGISSSAQDALVWVREAYRAMQKRHLGTERHTIALPLFVSLSDVMSSVSNNIMVLAVDLRHLAGSMKSPVDSASPEPEQENFKVEALLRQAEELVATAKEQELALAEAVQRMRSAAKVAATELKKVLQVTHEAFNVAARMTAPIPAYLLEVKNQNDFHEYVVKEHKLLRDMTLVIKEGSVLAGTNMLEMFHSAFEYQRRFVVVAEFILRGENPSENLTVSELKEEANQLKRAVHWSARRILNSLSRTYADNAAAGATLGILNPKGESDWMAVRFVPLAHLTEQMENLSSRVIHAVETAKYNMHNLAIMDGGGSPDSSPVETDEGAARR